MRKSNNYGLKKWIFGLLAFVAIFGSETAVLSGTSAFLNLGLINWLPALLFVVSAGSIINYVFNLLLSRKLSVNKSLIVTFLLLMGLIAACFYMQDNLPIYLFLSLLVARLGMVVFDNAVMNLASSYVNPRQAKSFLPLIRGVIDVAILASSVMIYILATLNWRIDGLWVVIGSLAVMIVLIMTISKIFEPVVGGKEAEPSSKALSKNSLKQSMNWVFHKSKLFNSLAWLFFLFGGLAVLFVYVYNNAFAENLHGENLTKFIALVNIAAILLRSIFDFAFLKKAIFRLGVANLLLIYPWLMFLLTFVISVWTGNLYLASALYVFHVISYYSYVTVVTQSMFGVVPKELNQQVYFLIKGVMPSVAALLTSILMVIVTYFIPDSAQIMSILLFLFVAGTMSFAMRIRQQYQGALVMSVDGNDQFLKGNAIELMGEKVQVENGEKLLRKIVIDPNEPMVLRQKALTSLVEIGNPNSIREFLLILENDKNNMLRYYSIQAINRVFEKMDKKRFGSMDVTKLLMIDVFNKVYEEDLPLPVKLEVNQALRVFGFDILLDFYKRHFVSSSEFVKASIIDALSVAEDRGLITLLEPHLESNDLGMRSAAIAGLWRFDEMRDRLMTKLLDIFANKETAYRLESLKLISKLKIKKMDDYVLDLVAVQEKKVSIMAVVTSVNLGKEGGVKVLVRKLVKSAMLGDEEMTAYILMKFSLLTSPMKQKFLSELRALGSANFDQLKMYFQKSDYYFDLELANLFNS